MSMSLFVLHIGSAGIWLGCVLTETLFERALLGKGKEQELILVELHKKVDLFVEIPAFCVVITTGILLFTASAGGNFLWAKIAIGLVAVLVNIYCVSLVWQRADAAFRSDWEEFLHLDHKQHKYGALVFVAIVSAFALGLSNV